MHPLSRLFLPLFLLCAVALPAVGQNRPVRRDDDFRARLSFALTRQTTDKLAFVWSEELRFKDSWSRTDRIQSALGAAYDLRPWLKTGIHYTLIAVDRGSDRSWQIRHRFHLELTFRHRCGAWTFSLRERPQATVGTGARNPAETPRTVWVWRHRAMAEYRLRALPLRPYAFVELTQTLNAPNAVGGNRLEKIRTSAGLKWQFTAGSSFDLYYRYDRETGRERIADAAGTPVLTDRIENRHIIGLQYGFRF